MVFFRVCTLLVGLIFLISCGEKTDPAVTKESDSLEAALRTFNALITETEKTLAQSKYFTSDVERAEAYRYLSGMMAVQLRDHLHFSVDPAYPTLHRVTSIGNKWGYSNPDNLYLAAGVSSDYDYRISGRLGSANHTIIGSYSGDDEDGLAGQRVLGRNLKTDPKGNFELYISKTRPADAENWIELVKDATSITIYQVFGDWEKERKGSYRIEAIGMAGKSAPLLSQKLASQQLVTAGETVRDRIHDWMAISKRLDLLPDNSFMPARQIQIASLGSWFQYGNYDIEEDEALIIEVNTPTNARYWGLTLYNWWGETLDYKNRQTSLNHTQAHIDKDGKLRIVLAARDPGVQNWLDVSGHLRGPINWRVNDPEKPETFQTKKLKLSELSNHLPDQTSKITVEQRRDIIAARQQQVDWRYSE